MAQIRKWKPIRNGSNVIVGIDRGKPKATRITKRQYDDAVRRLVETQTMLRYCIAYLDGQHHDTAVIERARRIAV